MEDIVRRLSLRLKMHKTSGTPVHHAALLKKFLDHRGLKTEMIKGYCVIFDTKEACDHYWIRDTDSGLDLDVAFEVAKLKSPELQTLNPVLLETIPPGLNRSDETEWQIRRENERLFELFQQDSKAFWREAPQDVKDFRLN